MPRNIDSEAYKTCYAQNAAEPMLGMPYCSLFKTVLSKEPTGVSPFPLSQGLCL
jgi:hypothetical protein